MSYTTSWDTIRETDMSFTHMHQKVMAQQCNRGRCLHYDNGARCDAIISAHSVQKGGQLNLIVEQGHVYQLSADHHVEIHRR